jgi:hypothetical protein
MLGGSLESCPEDEILHSSPGSAASSWGAHSLDYSRALFKGHSSSFESTHLKRRPSSYRSAYTASSSEAQTYPLQIFRDSLKDPNTGSYLKRSASLSSSLAPLNRVNSSSSLASANSRASRRGRRRWSRRNSMNSSPSTGIFNCTFCTKGGFPYRYAWKRHEESVHVPRKFWVCGGTDQSRLDQAQCLYCGDFDHMEEHQHLSCLQKSESNRTFFRRDGLMQHLRTTHKVANTEANMAYLEMAIPQWEREAPPLEPESPFLI